MSPFHTLAGKAGKLYAFLLVWLEKLEFFFGANNFYISFFKIELSKAVLFGIYYLIMVQYLHNDLAVNCVKF